MRHSQRGLEKYGIKSDEHIPVTFSWTTTIDVDGNAVTTPMLVANA